METLTCRLLPEDVADGQRNMAADELLVRSAVELGTPALRFYRWQRATVSLGYFQPADIPLIQTLPFVRRPSGGKTLVHHHELTYALALPPGERWHNKEPWLVRMHRIIACALSTLGVATRLVGQGEQQIRGALLCFQQLTPGDVVCAGHKIVGSAQRKYHLALMQHGSILLARSEHAPQLPGIEELADLHLGVKAVVAAVQAAFCNDTGWEFVPAHWREQEEQQLGVLVREKYGQREWSYKR